MRNLTNPVSILSCRVCIPWKQSNDNCYRKKKPEVCSTDGLKKDSIYGSKWKKCRTHQTDCQIDGDIKDKTDDYTENVEYILKRFKKININSIVNWLLLLKYPKDCIIWHRRTHKGLRLLLLKCPKDCIVQHRRTHNCLRLLLLKCPKDCIVQHRSPSALYNITVPYTLIKENFDHYTYEYIV